jgi:hypothetical protein
VHGHACLAGNVPVNRLLSFRIVSLTWKSPRLGCDGCEQQLILGRWAADLLIQSASRRGQRENLSSCLAQCRTQLSVLHVQVNFDSWVLPCWRLLQFSQAIESNKALYCVLNHNGLCLSIVTGMHCYRVTINSWQKLTACGWSRINRYQGR